MAVLVTPLKRRSIFRRGIHTLAPDEVDAFFTSYPCIVLLRGTLLTFHLRAARRNYRLSRLNRVNATRVKDAVGSKKKRVRRERYG